MAINTSDGRAKVLIVCPVCGRDIAGKQLSHELTCPVSALTTENPAGSRVGKIVKVYDPWDLNSKQVSPGRVQ